MFFKCVESADDKQFVVGKIYESQSNVNDATYYIKTHDSEHASVPIYTLIDQGFRFDRVYTMEEFAKEKVCIEFNNEDEEMKFLLACDEDGFFWANGSTPTEYIPSFYRFILCEVYKDGERILFTTSHPSDYVNVIHINRLLLPETEPYVPMTDEEFKRLLPEFCYYDGLFLWRDRCARKIASIEDSESENRKNGVSKYQASALNNYCICMNMSDRRCDPRYFERIDCKRRGKAYV